MMHRVPPAALLLLGSLLAGGLAPAANAQDEVAPSYRRVSAREAVVRNLADDAGVEIVRVPHGGLLRVRPSGTDWLAAEVPGGYPVWVFGSLLRGTEVPDVLEVVGNAVNMRPRPKSDVNSFPLPQRLHAGDRVRLAEALDPAANLSETWVRIWSPEGVHAYVRSSDVEDLAAGEDGAALWKASIAALPAERAPAPVVADRGRPAEAIAPKNEVAEARARKALAGARTMLERERQTDSPDFAGVRAAVAEARNLDTGEAVALEAQFLLDQVAFYEEARALRAELEARKQMAAAGQPTEGMAELDQRVKAKDPLRGAFLSRGVLVRRHEIDGTARYFLYFGGRTVSELVCSSGRYDLEVFCDYEVGVQGAEANPPGAAEAGDVRRIDVGRLEVIKSRP